MVLYPAKILDLSAKIVFTCVCACAHQMCMSKRASFNLNRYNPLICRGRLLIFRLAAIEIGEKKRKNERDKRRSKRDSTRINHASHKTGRQGFANEMKDPSSFFISFFFNCPQKWAVIWNFVYSRQAFIWSLCRFCLRCGLEEKGKANREKRYCSTRSRWKNVEFYKRK